jgi:hypothetical protein
MGKRTLFLAAGHGGNDRGNTSAGVNERDELITFTNGVKRWLDLTHTQIGGAGGVVILDHKLDLAGEIKEIGRWTPSSTDGDLAINFHLDYRPKDMAGGALAIVDETPYARTFAEQFLRDWCLATGIRFNGVHYSKQAAAAWRGWDDYGFCRPTWPGLILELGCLSHAPDLAIVRDVMCQALAAQIIKDVWKL